MAEESAWPTDLVVAAELLVSAVDFAHSLHRSPWDFAVEIEELNSAGIRRPALRWLVCQGFLDHAIELEPGPAGERRFKSSGLLTLDRRTCCVLTADGYDKALGAILKTRPAGEESINGSKAAAKHVEEASDAHHNGQPIADDVKPVWSADLGRLTLGRTLIKEMHGPAQNQRMILSAFQEEGWPERIDDPLPPLPGLEPKKRLKEAIAALNRKQRTRLIHFSGDGQGRGVRWRLIVDTPTPRRHQLDALHQRDNARTSPLQR